MPRYSCVGLTADGRPLFAMPVSADDPIVAEQVARKLWQNVGGIESVEVWFGGQCVYPQSAELKAAG